MANTKADFLTITQRIFSNWTALRLTVEHGAGTQSEALALCAHMTEFMYSYDDLDIDDVSVELEEYLDTNFTTVLEDGSSVQVASELLRFFKYLIEGKQSTVIEELDKLPPAQSWLVSSKNTHSAISTTYDSSSDEDAIKADDADDGWRKVTSKRSK